MGFRSREYGDYSISSIAISSIYSLIVFAIQVDVLSFVKVLSPSGIVGRYSLRITRRS